MQTIPFEKRYTSMVKEMQSALSLVEMLKCTQSIVTNSNDVFLFYGDSKWHVYGTQKLKFDNLGDALNEFTKELYT